MNRRASSLGALFVIATAAAAVVLTLFFPQPLVTIHIRWAPAIDAAARVELEGAFQLAPAGDADGRTYVYTLGDPSGRAIRAITRHPAVEDTAHLDRRWERPEFWSDRLRLIAFFSALTGLVCCLLALLVEVAGRVLQRGGAWHRWAIVAALVVGVSVSARVWQIPMQVTDSLIPMLQAQAAPGSSPSHFLSERSFLRPLYWSQIRLLMEVSGSDGYRQAFKGVQMLLVMALFVCFGLAARVRTAADCAAFVFALVVMVGMPTFTGMVSEAYPINHYLEVAVATLAAFVLVRRQQSKWTDAAAIALFTAAVFTLESGLLVLVVLAAGRLVGWKGVSRPALSAVGLIAVAYLYLRFVHLSTGVPDLAERATGFGFGRLEPAQTVALFAGREFVLYAYNIIASLLSLLLSEPRGGQFTFLAAWLDGSVRPVQVFAVASSAVTTFFIARLLIARLRAVRAVGLDDDLRTLLVAGAVAGGNALFCAVYVKDEIMSTAGVFYALAACTAVRHLLADAGAAIRRPVMAATLSALLLATGVAWDARALSLHYRLYSTSIATRSEWAAVDQWLDEQGASPSSVDGVQVVDALRASVARMPVYHARFTPRWMTRWME